MADYFGLAMMMGGSGMSAYSTIQGGNEAAEIGKVQQAQFNAEADATTQAGAQEALAKRKEGQRLTATQIAAISASGGGLVGSNLVLMAESAMNVEADARTIGINADTKANTLRQQGKWARYEGQLTKSRARTRAWANVIGTAGQAYAMHKYWNPSTPKIEGAGLAGWGRRIDKG